jgi:hypothetical protein
LSDSVNVTIFLSSEAAGKVAGIVVTGTGAGAGVVAGADGCVQPEAARRAAMMRSPATIAAVFC